MLSQPDSESPLKLESGLSGNFGNNWPNFLAPEGQAERLFNLMGQLNGWATLGPGGFSADVVRLLVESGASPAARI